MTALDPRLADKLARICGMFGSDHHGERAAAAAKADELIRAHGLTWADIIPPSTAASSPISVEQRIAFCVAHGLNVLSAWEWGFVTGVSDWPGSLTAKQLAKLNQLVGKVRAARCAPC